MTESNRWLIDPNDAVLLQRWFRRAEPGGRSEFCPTRRAGETDTAFHMYSAMHSAD
jgi:hypothetical protein